MPEDYLGNPVTADDPATLAAIDAFVAGFLGYDDRLLGITAAADADPGACLANTYAGWLCLLAETPAGAGKALPYLLRAEEAAGAATARERLAARALGAWIRDDAAGAARHLEALLAAAPRDLAALKLHQYLEFNRGNAAAMLRTAQGSRAAAADLPAFHAMLAFAYEECHRLAEAERAARTALAHEPGEPWAQHALAHVMLAEGRIAEGIGFLEAAAPGWEHLNSFMYTHNWWHLALCYLSEGRDAAALAVHDRHCWARDRGYSQDQVGAVSLLARLELAGADVGARWELLAPHLAARGADTVLPFLAVQYLWGLARAGRAEAELLLAAIRARAEAAHGEARAAWHTLALPLAEGILRYLAGDARAALAKLGGIIDGLEAIGGSHAQRDLFVQVYLDALVAAGRWDEARARLEARRGFEPDGVALNRALARVYAALGLDAQAAEAAQRARR